MIINIMKKELLITISKFDVNFSMENFKKKHKAILPSLNDSRIMTVSFEEQKLCI